MGIMTGIAAAAASLWKRAPGAPVRSEAAAARLFSNRVLEAFAKQLHVGVRRAALTQGVHVYTDLGPLIIIADGGIDVYKRQLRGSSLHSSIDGLLGDVLALDDSNQNGGRAGRKRHCLLYTARCV